LKLFQVVLYRLFHRTILFKANATTDTSYQRYKNDKRLEVFCEMARIALNEFQVHLQTFCEQILEHLGLKTSVVCRGSFSEEEIMEIIGQQKALPGNIISSLESMTVELDKSNQLREVFKTLSLEDYKLYSEYYFFGDFNCPVNNLSHSIQLPPSTGQNLLNSLNDDAWVMAYVISDMSRILNEDMMHNYQAVETLEKLINGDRKIVFDPNFKKIFLPHYHQSHYSLFILNLEDKNEVVIYYYNSYKPVRRPILFENIYKLFIKHVKKDENYQIPTKYSFMEAISPQQENGNDCGIYTILNMIHPRAGERNGEIKYPHTSEYISQYRSLIKDSLLNGSFIPKLQVLLMEMATMVPAAPDEEGRVE
jgi:predicted DNA-binding protein